MTTSALEPARSESWPALRLEDWRDTYATLHMWTQIAGKICLKHSTLVNHWWNVAFDITPRGLSTRWLVAGERCFLMRFDFIGHTFDVECSDGCTEHIALEPKPVADFYREVMELMQRLDIDARIWRKPVEVPEPAVPFDEDFAHRSYDKASVTALHQIFVHTKAVFEEFRARFVGKCSPVQFFWGGFDVACTRFSGRAAPKRAPTNPMQDEAYSHEVISHGFWPGSLAVQELAYYAYAAPEPAGLAQARVRPAAAAYNSAMGEFILPYDAVRLSSSPESTLMDFLQSTYDVAADLAHWDRAELERR